MDGTCSYETSNGVRGDVAKTAMECMNVDLFGHVHACGRVGVLNFVEPVAAGRDFSNEFAGWVVDFAGFLLECEFGTCVGDTAN